jgi:hypothetical protein
MIDAILLIIFRFGSPGIVAEIRSTCMQRRAQLTRLVGFVTLVNYVPDLYNIRTFLS